MDRTPHGLNFGCGPDWPDWDQAPNDGTWEHWDIIDYGQPSVGDFERWPADAIAAGGLPWKANRFDGIVANHSLQCLTYDEVEVTLAEFRRVLRPGGRLRVLVPDVFRACMAYQDGDDDWPGFAAISEPWSIDRKFAHYLTWGGSNRSCFTRVSLAEALDRAGFVEAFQPEVDWRWLRALDSRLGESIATEAQA